MPGSPYGRLGNRVRPRTAGDTSGELHETSGSGHGRHRPVVRKRRRRRDDHRPLQHRRGRRRQCAGHLRRRRHALFDHRHRRAELGLGSAITYEHPAYVDGDADSKWISGRDDGQTGAPSSHTTYRTTFSLTGLNPFTASISGFWGTDNEGEIFLNGVTTGIKLFGNVDGVLDGGDFGNFDHLTAFSITSGFVSGLNTLDFVILDTGPPSAMRVDNLAGTAAVVPEPATWALMILGFGSAGAVLRRRRGVAAL